MKDFVIKRQERKNYVQMTCRFEEELLDKIDETVLEYNLNSKNALINDCVRFALENMRIEE